LSKSVRQLSANPVPQKSAKRLFNIVWTKSISSRGAFSATTASDQRQQVCSQRSEALIIVLSDIE
jgi:hypothetical protein